MEKKINSEIREFVSRRLSRLKNARKFTARDMSKQLGQSTEYINQIETGKSMPSIERLYDICNYLGISMSDFFDDKTEYPIQYKGLFKELNKLDEQELAQIIDLIKLITRNKK